MSTSFGISHELDGPYSASGTGWRRLDIMDRIFDQDPRATPFFELTGQSTATNRDHFWQVRGVKARASAAVTEGKALTGQQVSAPTRARNRVQTNHTGVEITRFSQKEAHYGVASIWEDQVNLRSYEHRASCEFDLISSTEVTETASTVPKMKGLLASITTNVSAINSTSLTETRFLDMLEISWQNQDSPVLTCMVNSKLKRAIDLFSAGGATRNIDAQTGEIRLNTTKYYSTYGEVDVVLSRDLNNTASFAMLVLFDKMPMNKAYLDRTHLQPVAKTKDADTMVIIDDLTLEFGNEEANVKYSGWLV